MPSDEKVQGEFGSYIDQDTITKAIGNKYSTAAQIATQQRRAKANASAALAARGSLHSGALTNRNARITEEAEGGRYRAVQEFLTGARGGLAGLGEAKTRLEQDIADAMGRAGAAAGDPVRLRLPDRWTTPADVAPITAPPVAAPAAAAPKPRAETPAQRALRLVARR